MLIVGWRLRERAGGYGLVLQGGGVGVLYLVVFGAFRIWQLMPPELAFGLLVVIAVASATLAIAQDSRSLAIAGVSGGFLAPLLASTGQGSHVVLFSYYVVLDLGVLFIAWHKAWRALNLLGFAFTFAIGTVWGGSYYRPEHYAVVFFPTLADLSALVLAAVGLVIPGISVPPPAEAGLSVGSEMRCDTRPTPPNPSARRVARLNDASLDDGSEADVLTP